MVTRWANPEADVELHVFEPCGSHCYSMTNTTPNGGVLSCDCVGFGPEEYWIKRAVPGQYDVQVKLFSNTHKHQPVVVSVWVWAHFGHQKNERSFKSTVVLKNEKEMVHVVSVTFL